MLKASHPFMGVVVGVGEAGIVADGGQGLKQLGGNCVTHASKLNTDTLSFVVDGEAIARAVVVFEKAGAIHVYAKASTVVNPTKEALVVGGGTGGIAAARTLHDLGYTVVVYDRGPPQPVSFDVPILQTYQTYPNNAHVAPVKGSLLGWGPGGTQSINGAVYAPGTPEDLARSLGGGSPS